MNQGYYRPPTTSRASATTKCQKCLKLDKSCRHYSCTNRQTNLHSRHYSYECKAPAQERPYQARPSRTAQLLNPKLAPKLSSDVPNDLLRKKGVADEVLAAKERGRKRSRSASYDGKPRKRSSRSVSSSSVSTISTAASRSVSPPPRRRRPSPSRFEEDGDRYMTSQNVAARDAPRKRPRRSPSASSNSSYASHSDRNTRRRRSSRSPAARGRRRSRSVGENRRSFSKRQSRSGSRHSGRKTQNNSFRSDGPANGNGPVRNSGGYGNGNGGARGPPPPPKERSLSPYSKRLALTQAMN